MTSWVQRDDDGSFVDAFVQPRSRKDALAGTHGGSLKVKVTAPPVDGKANSAVQRLLAESLGIPAARVRVVSGHASRHKRIRVDGMGPETVVRLLTAVLSSRAHDGG